MKVGTRSRCVIICATFALASCARDLGATPALSVAPNSVAPASSAYRVLANFGDSTSPASQPEAGLVDGGDGNFYGTTVYGGIANQTFPLGCGAVYRVTPAGKLTALHEFTCSVGAGPTAALLLASDGFLYGSTLEGSGKSANGLIFRIARSGKSFHVLHYFRTNQDGGFPDAALIAEDDWLYGTLEEGPPSSSGAVFRMHPDGTGFVVLHAFMETEGSIVDRLS